MSSSDILAANVKQRREALGLTQEALGALARLGGATIYQYEAGKRSAKVGTSLDDLAVALGCEPWELLLPPGVLPERTPTSAAVRVTIGSDLYRLVKA